MKRYFKHASESEYGVGVAFIEVTGDWPSRQVEVYGETWHWGDETHPEHLADQPLEVFGIGDEHAITAAEFEQVWREALERCPPRS